ncbi:hypothetical protein WHR41_08947 [Cladosporium halotolerans]|uniref:HCP-like protein n=1 Tax=Cladosporium halotolerans TaxID=1052096 RepID=A0AB34KF73_9PEZI
MNGLKDLLRKKESISKDASTAKPPAPAALEVPEFKIIRTTTESEEVIEPPSFDGDNVEKPAPAKEQKKERRRTLFSRSSSAHTPRDAGKTRTSLDSEETKGANTLAIRPKQERRLSERLHIGGGGGRSRSKSQDAATSSHLPENLPAAPDSVSVPSIHVNGAADEGNKYVNAQREAQWEKRATILASSSPFADPSAPSSNTTNTPGDATDDERTGRPLSTLPTSASTPRDRSRSVATQQTDISIQEAIRLHESGDLTASTAMFGTLASPTGANNALSQVLYGLALRHGWGIDAEPARAIHFLSLAASNSAAVEQAALEAGMTKGGAAKGELVLAIFELANCFRYAWGVKKDPLAARQYYETAANLGDTDAMEEAAWCFLEGFGGPKDKFKAAQYLRLAEQKGSKTVGNSWIWKDKYNPKPK